MDDLLTTRQVQELLKVDRITVYRMLNDGRLKGVKIGQQWRFPAREVERLLSGCVNEPPETSLSGSAMPRHCLQIIQDVFAEMGQMGALIVDLNGAPLTEMSAPCALCTALQHSPGGQAACRTSWQHLAQSASAGRGWSACHAGLHYSWIVLHEDNQPVALLLAGQVDLRPEDASERPAALAQRYNLNPAQMEQANALVRLLASEQRQQTERWLERVAAALESILKERSSLMKRLQRIAEISDLNV